MPINTGTWTVWGTGTQRQLVGFLEQTASGVSGEYIGIYSNSTFDFTNRAAVVQIAQLPSASTGSQAVLRAEIDANNAAIIGYSDGGLLCQHQLAGTITNVSFQAWPAGTVGLALVFDNAQSLLWFATSDGTTWTSRFSEAIPITTTALRISIATGCYQALASPGTTRWDSTGLAVTVRPVNAFAAACFDTAGITNLWDFEETAGSYTDYLGAFALAVNGTITRTTDAGLYLGKAATFLPTRTTSDYVGASATAPPLFKGMAAGVAFSVEWWAKQDAGSGGQMLGAASPTLSSGLTVTSSSPQGQSVATFVGGSGNNSGVSTGAPNGAWLHYVYTYDPTQPTFKGVLYVNGKVNSQAGGGGFRNETDIPFRLGSGPTGGNRWDGSIAAFALYNLALTPAQVLTHYLAGIGGGLGGVSGGRASVTVTLSKIKGSLFATAPGKATAAGVISRKRPLTGTSIGLTPGVYRNKVIDDTPLAYWRLGEPSGTAAADTSGNGHGGTYAASGVTLGQPSAMGDGGTSVTLAGTTGATGLVSIPASAAWRPVGGGWSMEAWVNHSSQSGTQEYVRLGGTDGWFLRSVGQTINTLWSFGGGVINSASGGILPSAGVWYHIVGTYDGAYIRHYRNGLLVYQIAETRSFTPTSTNGLAIGAQDPSTGGEFFLGSMDEVAVYNYALSDAQIRAHYLAAPGAPTVISKRLAGEANWTVVDHFAEGSPDKQGFTSSTRDTTGAKLLILACSNLDTSFGISDNKGNTWVLASENTNSYTKRIYYAASPIVGPGHTFSMTGVDSSPSMSLLAMADGATAPLDQSNNGGGYSSTAQPGSVTPTVGSELVVTSTLADGESGTYAIDGGFTITDQIPATFGAHWGIGVAILKQTAPAAANPTWTATGFNLVGAVIASFMPGVPVVPGALTGSSSGQGVASAQISRRRSLTGSSTGATLVSVALTRRRLLTGTSPGTATTVATPTRRRNLTAASAGAASMGTLVTYPSSVLADAPTGYWRLGEPSGTTATDTSGNGNTGTHHFVTLGIPGAVTGDTAIDYYNSGGWTTIPDVSTLNVGAGDFTFEAWINLQVSGSNSPIWWKSNNLQVNTVPGNLMRWGQYLSGVWNYVTATNPLTVSSWCHVAIVKSGNTITHYLNGVANGTGSVSGPHPGAAFEVRLSTTDPAGDSTGYAYLDEVAVYPTALSAARLSVHYSAASGGALTPVRITAKRSLIVASAGIATANEIWSVKRSIVALAAGVAVATGVVGKATQTKDITGTTSGVSTTTATATRRRSVTGTSSGVATEVGQPTRRRSLVVASAGTATANAQILTRRALVGTSSGQTTVSGTVIKTTPTIASNPSNGVATVSVQLTRRRVITGTSAGVATEVGQPSAKRRLLATSAGVSVASGLILARRSIVSTTVGVAITTAQIIRKVAIVASAAGKATAIGQPQIVSSNIPAVSSNGKATVSGQIARKFYFTVSPSAGTTVVSGVPTRKRPIVAASSSGIAAVTLVVTARRSLTVSITGVATATAQVARRRGITASVTGASTTVGLITRRRSLLVTSAGRGVSTGAPARTIAIVVSITGVATTTGSLSHVRPIIGSSAGQTTVVVSIQRTRSLVAVAAGTSTATGLLLRKRGTTGVSNGVATTTRAQLITKRAIVGISGGKTTVSGRIINLTLVLWNGSTFTLAGSYPVVLWDQTEFQTAGESLDYVAYKGSTDQFNPVHP